MGIYSRDYVRDSAGGPGPRYGGSSAPVCKTLILINIAVFIAQLLVTRVPPELVQEIQRIERETGQRVSTRGLPRESIVEEWFELDPYKTVYRGQVWRLLTHAFCHSRTDLWHIVFNMLYLWWFGARLESMYGSREFRFFYLTAAVVAGLGFVAFGLFMHDLTPAIGASGAVMAVVMLFGLHFPRERVYIWGVLPIEVRWLVAFFVIVDLHPVLFSLAYGAPSADGVAHSAHLGGLAFGWLYKKQHWQLSHTWDRLIAALGIARRRKRAGRHVRLYEPPAEPVDLDAKVDAILEKIHQSGEASLTDEEREILRRASRQYRQRL